MERFYNPNTGYAKTVLTYKNHTFVGEAHCHPFDIDHKSEYVGSELADSRALCKYLRFIRDNEIKPSLASLKQLYYSMKQSTHFNPKSYEAKMLNRQIRYREDDLEAVKNMIEQEKKHEYHLIRFSEQIYKKINNNKNKDYDE